MQHMENNKILLELNIFPDRKITIEIVKKQFKDFFFDDWLLIIKWHFLNKGKELGFPIDHGLVLTQI